MSRLSLLLALLTAAGCGPASESPDGDAAPASAPSVAPASAPNVVFVSIDTLRFDVLGANGGFLPTPNLDALSGEGTRFLSADASAPATAASHATLFTGSAVPDHGVYRDGDTLPASARTLAEAFSEKGYHTAGFFSNAPLEPRFGWCQGFEHCDAALVHVDGRWPEPWRAFGGSTATDPYDRPAWTTTAAVRSWLDEAREPFFLFVHYADPHAPRRPPERALMQTPRVGYDVEGRRVPGIGPVNLGQRIRRYHAEVQVVDRQIAQLRRAIAASATRPLLTVVTGDHGEGLGQHRWLLHTESLYQELLHVPLIFHGPEIGVGQASIETPVSLVDVAPTVAEVAGLGALEDATGHSLAPSLRDGTPPPARPVVAYRVHETADGRRRAAASLRFGSWKLIRSPAGRGGLFDLDADPGETRDLASERPEVAAALGARLDAWVAEHPAKTAR